MSSWNIHLISLSTTLHSPHNVIPRRALLSQRQNSPVRFPLFLTSGTELTGRITGGTRGIGSNIALALSKAGADVLLVQRDTSNTSTRDAIRQEGGKADIVVCDLADKRQVKGLVSGIVGSGRDIDIVVNCGGSPSSPSPSHLCFHCFPRTRGED